MSTMTGYHRRQRNAMRSAMTVRTLRGIARRPVHFGFAVLPPVPFARTMTKEQLVAALDAREQEMRADSENWALYTGEPVDLVAETERGIMSHRLSIRDSRRFDETIGEMRDRRLLRELEAEEGFIR